MGNTVLQPDLPVGPIGQLFVMSHHNETVQMTRPQEWYHFKG